MANGADDFFDLVESAGAGKDGFADDQLTQDATGRPHVHSFGLHRGAQQDFGCTLPTGGDVVRENGGLVIVVLLCD